MILKHTTLLGVVPAVLDAALGKCTDYTKNGLVWGDAIRMNEIQVVGTHNSYHVEANMLEKLVMEKFSPNTTELWYEHKPLNVQLSQQHARNIELDIFADPEGANFAKPLVRKFANLPYNTGPEYNTTAIKVMHIADLDIHTSCTTFKACLGIIKSFIDAHPHSVPIPILTEFKQADDLGASLGGAAIIPWDNTTLLDSVDVEIRSVFPAKQLITPDDIRRHGMTLEESVLKHGWPNLDSARGRVMFLMDNGPNDKLNRKYVEGRPNLEGRAIFTNSAPGNPDCAFQKLNDADTDAYVTNMQKQVRAGYFVRTRADKGVNTAYNCTTYQRDMAFKSGAQIVSTDFPAAGMSERYGGCKYVVEVGGGKVARCNPVNGREGCLDAELE